MNYLQSLEKENVRKIVEDFREVYKDHKLMKHLFPNQSSRNAKIESLFRYRLKTDKNSCFQLSADGRGLIYLENRAENSNGFSIMHFVYGLMLLLDVGLFDLYRLIRFQYFSDQLLEKIGGKKCWYIDLFMVPKNLQGRGIGKKALIDVLEIVQSSGYPIYLETMDEKNVRLYKSFGFQIVASPKIPGSDITYYCMILPAFGAKAIPGAMDHVENSFQNDTVHPDYTDADRSEPRG